LLCESEKIDELTSRCVLVFKKPKKVRYGTYLTDAFTFQVIARESAYTREEVDILLKAAVDHSMEVVPLVQTFGHLGMNMQMHAIKGSLFWA
jgi:hypothetical protein